jgi:hypothetical protein
MLKDFIFSGQGKIAVGDAIIGLKSDIINPSP